MSGSPIPCILTLRNPTRRAKLKARWAEFAALGDPLQVFSDIAAWMAQDPFHRGRNDRGWKGSFDYLMRSDHKWLELYELAHPWADWKRRQAEARQRGKVEQKREVEREDGRDEKLKEAFRRLPGRTQDDLVNRAYAKLSGLMRKAITRSNPTGGGFLWTRLKPLVREAIGENGV